MKNLTGWFLLLSAAAAAAQPNDYPFQPVPLSAVRIQDGEDVAAHFGTFGALVRFVGARAQGA